jgi:alpha-1,6-mannosyltransferase
VTTVHITNAYHPTSGGIRTFYTALLEAANRHRRRVVLIVPGEREGREDIGRFGCIHVVAAPRAPAFDRRYRLLYPVTYLPGLCAPVARILEQEQPALVEICDKYSLPYLAAILRKRWHRRVRRPVLVGFSAERFDDNMAAYLARGRQAGRFTRWYLRHIYGPPFDVHLANSEYVAEELRAALPDRWPGFIRVLPMGVDVAGFGPARRSPGTRAQLLEIAGGGPRTTLLLYAGRLSPEKNIGLLLEMLRRLTADPARDYRLVLAGDGPLAPALRGAAAGMDGRLSLLGPLDRDALARCCASCDVFVHPNPREPFGIGPLEAMASGIPVVLPRAGGVREYADEGNAWLAEPTAADFADAVRAAARGGAERIAGARTTARGLAWSRVAARYFAFYDELAGETRLRELDAVVTHE